MPVGYDQDGDIEYEQDERIESWPARFKRDRPDWFQKLESYIKHERAHDFAGCLLQVYTALDHDLNVLAVIGIRTTFDVASEILGVDPDQAFESKLQAMEDKGLITPSQRTEFDILINAGNASAHRGWTPEFKDLDALMDTLEHFINAQFVAPRLRELTAKKVAEMKGKVPARPKKAKAATPKPPPNT